VRSLPSDSRQRQFEGRLRAALGVSLAGGIGNNPGVITRVAAVAAAAALAAAAGAGATGTSGLRGTVTRGPIAPVCIAGQPCSAPAPGVTLTFTRAGRPAVRVRTGSGGAYRIVLAPGAYSVTASAGRRIDPHAVRVTSGTFRRVDLAIDTGIR
jgi:hypothetical protein